MKDIVRAEETRPSRLRIVLAFLMLAPAVLALSGCGKGKGPGMSNLNGSPTSGTSSTGPAQDEATVLAAPDLQASLVLHLDPDAFNAAQQIAALNGTDPKPTQGAQWETGEFVGCSGNETQQYSVGADINGMTQNVSINPDDFKAWLLRHDFYQERRFPITYSNVQQGTGGSNYIVFICPVMSDSVTQYLPPDQQGNIHNGINIPFGKRVFKAWTYENRYDTPSAGQGTVKVFAGTFAYSIQSTIPTLSFNGDGTGTAKAMLNPDTGKWQLVQFQLQDPPLLFQ